MSVFTPVETNDVRQQGMTTLETDPTSQSTAPALPGASSAPPGQAGDVPTELQEIELDLLLEGIYRRYGYDFRDYARASLRRRILHSMSVAGIPHITDLLTRVLHDETAFDALVRAISITTTDMFRDPSFFAALREHVIPILKTYPFIKIWHAGCSTGAEVYSLAILLEEEGFYNRSQIYATDINGHALLEAKAGIYPLDLLQKWAAGYTAAGGRKRLDGYYDAAYGFGKLHGSLRRNITFTYHNLVTDSVFGEMNLILCRNVLIYFNPGLQARVISLFASSLCHQGFLCLGTKESLELSRQSERFIALTAQYSIYRKRAHHGSEPPLDLTLPPVR